MKYVAPVAEAVELVVAQVLLTSCPNDYVACDGEVITCPDDEWS